MIVPGSKWKDREDGEIVTVVQVINTRVVYEDEHGKRDGAPEGAFLKCFEEVVAQ